MNEEELASFLSDQLKGSLLNELKNQKGIDNVPLTTSKNVEKILNDNNKKLDKVIDLLNRQVKFGEEVLKEKSKLSGEAQADAVAAALAGAEDKNLKSLLESIKKKNEEANKGFFDRAKDFLVDTAVGNLIGGHLVRALEKLGIVSLLKKSLGILRPSTLVRGVAGGVGYVGKKAFSGVRKLGNKFGLSSKEIEDVHKLELAKEKPYSRFALNPETEAALQLEKETAEKAAVKAAARQALVSNIAKWGLRIGGIFLDVLDPLLILPVLWQGVRYALNATKWNWAQKVVKSLDKIFDPLDNFITGLAYTVWDTITGKGIDKIKDDLDKTWNSLKGIGTGIGSAAAGIGVAGAAAVGIYKYFASKKNVLSEKEKIANLKTTAEDYRLALYEETAGHTGDYGSIGYDTAGGWSLGGFQFSGAGNARAELINKLKQNQSAFANIPGAVSLINQLSNNEAVLQDKLRFQGNKDILSAILRTQQAIAYQNEIEKRDYGEPSLQAAKNIRIGSTTLANLAGQNSALRQFIISQYTNQGGRTFDIVARNSYKSLEDFKNALKAQIRNEKARKELEERIERGYTLAEQEQESHLKAVSKSITVPAKNIKTPAPIVNHQDAKQTKLLSDIATGGVNNNFSMDTVAHFPYDIELIKKNTGAA